MENIYLEADKEGMARASECVPTPMVVGSPTTPLGSDIDYDKKTYYVADGVCGFAWINIKPARGKLVAWLKSKGIGRKDDYYGGYTIWVKGYGQSLAKKEAYARGFVSVLDKYGFKSYAMSRMD